MSANEQDDVRRWHDEGRDADMRVVDGAMGYLHRQIHCSSKLSAREMQKTRAGYWFL